MKYQTFQEVWNAFEELRERRTSKKDLILLREMQDAIYEVSGAEHVSERDVLYGRISRKIKEILILKV